MSRKPDAKGNEVLFRAWWEWMQGDLAAARVAADAIARLLAAPTARTLPCLTSQQSACGGGKIDAARRAGRHPSR